MSDECPSSTLRLRIRLDTLPQSVGTASIWLGLSIFFCGWK